MNANTVDIRPLACLRTDLWPHRKEVQAPPMERDRDREKIPLGLFPAAPWAVGLILHWDFHRETSRCVRSELHKQGWGEREKGRDLLSSSYFIYRHESWKSLTHNDVLSDGDDMSVVLPAVAVGQSGFIWTHQVYMLFSAVSKSFPSIRTWLIWFNAFVKSVRWRSVNSLNSSSLNNHFVQWKHLDTRWQHIVCANWTMAWL